MNYREWINGNGCCQPTNNCGCGGKDVCDCEEILLEISKLHTDDEILQDEIDYVSGVVDTESTARPSARAASRRLGSSRMATGTT